MKSHCFLLINFHHFEDLEIPCTWEQCSLSESHQHFLLSLVPKHELNWLDEISTYCRLRKWHLRFFHIHVVHTVRSMQRITQAPLNTFHAANTRVWKSWADGCGRRYLDAFSTQLFFLHWPPDKKKVFQSDVNDSKPHPISSSAHFKSLFYQETQKNNITYNSASLEKLGRKEVLFSFHKITRLTLKYLQLRIGRIRGLVFRPF